MFKRKMIVLALLVCVGVAYGAAKKIKCFELTPFGALENPDGDGMVIFNYNQGQNETDYQIVLMDFLPNTEYGYDLTDHEFTMVRYPACGGIVTDEKGQAHLKATLAGVDWSDSGIIIYKTNAGCTHDFEDARAVGDPRVDCNH